MNGLWKPQLGMRLQCASRRQAAREARTGFNGIDGLTLSLVGGESVQQGEAGSLTWSRAIHPESKRRLGGTCGNAPRFTDGDAAGLCVAVPPVRQGGPAIAVRGRYPCANERRWASKAASALAVTGPPPLLRRWRRTASSCRSPPAASWRLAAPSRAVGAWSLPEDVRAGESTHRWAPLSAIEARSTA